MGLFGQPPMMGGGLRDTRTEEQKRRDAMAMGIDPATFDRMNGMSAPDMKIGVDTGGQAAPQERQPGYWQGGGKFGGRDALAAALAAVSDAFAQRGGSQNGAVGMLMGNRSTIMDRAREAQAAQQARAEGLQDYEAKQQIDQRYAAPDIPAAQKNYQWWDSLPPAEKAKYAQYQSVVNPKWITGADGVPQQMTGGGLPPGYDENEWEVVPQAGGGTGNGVGGFPPRFRR